MAATSRANQIPTNAQVTSGDAQNFVVASISGVLKSLQSLLEAFEKVQVLMVQVSTKSAQESAKFTTQGAKQQLGWSMAGYGVQGLGTAGLATYAPLKEKSVTQNYKPQLDDLDEQINTCDDELNGSNDGTLRAAGEDRTTPPALRDANKDKIQRKRTKLKEQKDELIKERDTELNSKQSTHKTLLGLLPVTGDIGKTAGSSANELKKANSELSQILSKTNSDGNDSAKRTVGQVVDSFNQYAQTAGNANQATTRQGKS